MKAWIDGIPMKRLLQPAEIASTIGFRIRRGERHDGAGRYDGRRLFRGLAAGGCGRGEGGRVKAGGGTVVLLDEPTAALGVERRSGVVRLIPKLKEDNHSVIVILHDLHDLVLEVVDRIVVLRLGPKVAEFCREEVNASDLVAAITGIRFRSSLQTDATAA